MTTPHCLTHHRPLICPACNGARGGKSKSAKKIAKATETIKQVNDRKVGKVSKP